LATEHVDRIKFDDGVEALARHASICARVRSVHQARCPRSSAVMRTINGLAASAKLILSGH
ncbi:hypothetical protein E4U55_001007, partial [Claviceps digitariae]